MSDAPLSRRRRRLLQAGLWAGAGALAGCLSPAPGPGRDPASPRLRLLGEANLPHGMRFRGTTVGGLSGLDHDPASGLWLALSDDRSLRQPARAYRLQLDYGPGWFTPRVLDVITLRRPDGTPWPRHPAGGERVDPEALRLRPGGASFLWTSEGDGRGGHPPALREASLDGRHLRDIPLPGLLHFDPAPDRGARDNATLEGLAVTPDGRHAWLAMEGPLKQDGPLPSPQSGGGPCRLTRIALASGRPDRQLAYPLEPLPAAPLVPGGLADNGISEILMLDQHRLLVLERSFVLGHGITLRLFEIDTRQGSDILGRERLAGSEGWQAVPKRLVADFASLGLSRLDNTESLAWGPPLANGRRCLVVVSDDNFNPMQVTQFAAFEYLESP